MTPTTPLHARDLSLAILRGVGQIMFQDHALTGAAFLLAVALASPIGGLAMLVGAVISTLAALTIGVDRREILSGLHGFNGALVGVAIATFFALTPLSWLYLAFGAGLSAPLTIAVNAHVRDHGLPGLTAPFVLATWLLVGARDPFAGLGASPAAGPATVALSMDVSTFGRGVFCGLSQVFLQDSAVTGAIVALGLLVGSPAAVTIAITGSALGTFAGLVLGSDGHALASGLYGYNAALTSLAVALFLPNGPRSFAMGMTAAVASSILTAAMIATLAPMGLPALTAPFVLVTWVALRAERALAHEEAT